MGVLLRLISWLTWQTGSVDCPSAAFRNLVTRVNAEHLLISGVLSLKRTGTPTAFPALAFVGDGGKDLWRIHLVELVDHDLIRNRLFPGFEDLGVHRAGDESVCVSIWFSMGMMAVPDARRRAGLLLNLVAEERTRTGEHPGLTSLTGGADFQSGSDSDRMPRSFPQPDFRLTYRSQTSGQGWSCCGNGRKVHKIA